MTTNDLVRLDSLTQEAASRGPLDKEEYFKFLQIPLQDYDMNLTPRQAASFRATIMSLRTGLHARVPLICPGGIKCPVGRQCDLTLFHADKNGKARLGHDGLPIIDTENSRWPVFKQCPYENTLIAMKVRDLCEEFEIDPGDPKNVTDMSIISKLAELDIYDARASQVLAKEAIILDEVTAIVINPRSDSPGTEITNKRLHPAFELKEKIHRMRQELIRSMIGDRHSKVKAQAALGQMGQSRLTDVMADLARRLNAPLEEQPIDVVVVEDVDAEFTVEESG